MNFKTTLVMAIVFAIGVATVLFLNKSDKEKKEQEQIAGKLLTVEKEIIDQIIIEPLGIHLVKDVNNWKISKPIEYAADNSAVNSITSLFGWANMERTVSSDPSQYSNFGLSPAKGKLIIGHESVLDTFFIGDKTPTEANLFARRSGSNDVFLTTTSLGTFLEKTLFDMRDKKLLDIESSMLSEIKIQNKYNTIDLKNNGATWNITSPVEWEVASTKISAITNSLNSEHVKEFIDNPDPLSKYGLSKPSMKLNFILGDNQSVKTLLVGNRVGNKCYVKDELKTNIFLVDTTFVGRFLAPVSAFRNKQITDINSDFVNKVELLYNKQHLVCVKDTSDTWFVESENNAKARNWKMMGIVREASRMTVDDFVADNPSSLAQYGLKTPNVICKLFQDDNLLLELHIGKSKDDKKYIKTTEKASVYLFNALKLEKFEPELTDLLETAEQAVN